MGEKRYKIVVLLMHANTLVMGIGFFMLIPILNNYLVNGLGMATAMVGYITGVRFLGQDLTSIFLGAVGDKIGCKRAMVIGAAIRMFGLLLCGFMSDFWGFFLSSFFVGLGGALFVPSCYSYYDLLANDQNRTALFSMREMLNNCGNIVGPAVGTFLMVMGFRWVCIVSAGVFALTIALSIFLLPDLKANGKSGAAPAQTSAMETVRTCLKNKTYILFLLITAITTGLMSQKDLTIPTRIKAIDPSYAYVGFIYTLASVVGVAVQLPLVKWCKGHLHANESLALANILYGVGLAIMGFVPALPALYAGTVIFTLGQMIYQPVRNMQVTDFAEPGKVGAYYGFQGTSLAAGTVLGNFLSGYLYDLAETPALRHLPWVVWCTLAAVACVLFWKFLKGMPTRDLPIYRTRAAKAPSLKEAEEG